MHILICNDDGIGAEGILALEELAADFGTPVVFAPETQQSGIGHQVTVDGPIGVKQVSENRYSVSGTPGDCVRIAVSQFDFDFELMFSGINSGGNLGVDVYMSGTAAAAREASYFGLESFAISQYRSKNYTPNWGLSKSLTQRALEFVRNRPDPGPGFWNINLPCTSQFSDSGHAGPVRVCKLDRNPHKLAYEKKSDTLEGQMELTYAGVYQDRPRDHSTDVDLCFGGVVTATRCL